MSETHDRGGGAQFSVSKKSHDRVGQFSASNTTVPVRSGSLSHQTLGDKVPLEAEANLDKMCFSVFYIAKILI